MLSMISGPGRIPNKHALTSIVNLLKGLQVQTRLGRCVFSTCHLLTGLGVFPSQSWGGREGKGSSFVKLPIPSGDWVLCHHATLMDVLAAFPSYTPVAGVRERRIAARYCSPALCQALWSVFYLITSTTPRGR